MMDKGTQSELTSMYLALHDNSMSKQEYVAASGRLGKIINESFFGWLANEADRETSIRNIIISSSATFGMLLVTLLVQVEHKGEPDAFINGFCETLNAIIKDQYNLAIERTNEGV